MIMKKLILTFVAAFAATAFVAAAATDTNAPSANAPAAVPAVAVASTNATAAADTSTNVDMTVTNAVRMNFHDAPLNTVLNYLSRRMGFRIVGETELHGTATMVSEQPIGTDEVLEMLSGVLAKDNYAVSRNGMILTISTLDNAKTGPFTPVNHPQSPAEVPVNDEVATDIIPVHTLNPTQLRKDLDELVPSGATLDANEAGNALIMTGRQKDIHRFFEIIAALDSSSVSEVEVFLLKFADSKSVADELKEVFQSPDSTVARADARTRFFGGRGGGGGGGFGGFPGFGGGGGGGGGNSSDSDKNASNKAVFVSDDQMNAVVASAPPDYFSMISNVVEKLDQPTTDITMMKVFFLKHADATEVANELTTLFPDDSSSSQNGRTMGTRFLPPWMQPQTPVSSKSDRMTREATVRAVPDPRTSSVVVTTSKDLMEQIAGVITQLDESDAQDQHVYAWKIDTADPVTVQAALKQLFPSSASSASSSSTQPVSALQSRQQSSAQQTTTSSGFGSTGGGGFGGGGGATGAIP
jgi:general secretion pathway protein D